MRWERPRTLVAVTWTYIAWALLPVGVAILFSFNAGRSRSVWQGFSLRWWTADPTLSILHDPEYSHALVHSLTLAGLDMAIATPLGVLLAIGLARWRGRGSGAANGLMLVPLVTPEIVMAVSLLLVFTQLSLVPFTLVHLGTTAQVVGQVTFSLSYVVVPAFDDMYCVTTKSSIESAKTISMLARIAGASSGSRTSRSAPNVVAPRSRAASS